MKPPRGALRGRGVVVTRPAGQGGDLVRLIEEAGGRALHFPTLEIEQSCGPALDAVIRRLEDFDLAIFVSRNAVDHGLARVRERRAWPNGLAVAAVGSGTRKVLQEHGFADVLAPQGPADSEALLALLAPAHGGPLAGKRIVIFRATGGREFLAHALRERGALVEYAACYRRGLARTDVRPLIEEWSRGGVQAVALSSGEGLANLARLLGASAGGLLAGTPLFVPHARIASQARALGAADAVVAGPADEDMLAALVAYFRPAG